MPSPFWGWSRPQISKPLSPGFTTVSTDADGVMLEPVEIGAEMLAVRVGGRSLEPGERITFVYGDGPAGAMVDRYAESGSRAWLAVDGDGDGVRAVVERSPEVDVAPGRPSRLLLHLPSIARPEARARLTVSIVDARANRCEGCTEQILVEVTEQSPAVSFPTIIRLEPADRCARAVEIRPSAEGVVRLRATTASGLEAHSNPMLVSSTAPRIRWADLHGHSQVSDGTGTPREYLSYARDVAGLDAAVLTDHDHWGVRFLDQSPDLWHRIVEQTEELNSPPRFVTFLGYEWTSWIHGHRHVLFGASPGKLISSMTPGHDSPEALWAQLRSCDALTIAHHSAGGPVAINWEIPPDAELEPVTEIVSVHGSSEAADAPVPIYDAVPGGWVRDALDRGYRLGFIGSGDSHDGHPGLTHLEAPCGGLAAIISEELSRSALLDAIRSRRTYATSGPRIILQVALAGRPMGSIISSESLEPGPAALFVRVIGTDVLDRIDLVRDGAVVATEDGGSSMELELDWRVPHPEPGEHLYVRVVQKDLAVAYSSPIFID
jgi:hypothetical protein